MATQINTNDVRDSAITVAKIPNDRNFMEKVSGGNVVVDSNGNLGVGTSSPGSYKVNINGNLNATQIHVGGIRKDNNWDDAHSHISDTGNVHSMSHSQLSSIGANDHHNRSHSLTSSSDHTGTLSVGMGGTGRTSITAGRIVYGAGTGAIGNTSDLFWNTSNTSLGIGTTTPDEKLEVVGDAKAQGFKSGDFEMRYNPNTKTLDFNFIGG